MKSWFAKFRISAALDAGHSASASGPQRAGGTDQVHVFEREMTALDRALKQTAPKPQAPTSLHGSIMRAVRAAERPAAVPVRLTFLPWLPAPVVAVLAVVVAWYVLHGPARPPAQDTQSLAAAASALEVGGQMAQVVPSAMIAPLSDELERLNRDLDNTARFLLASLP